MRDLTIGMPLRWDVPMAVVDLEALARALEEKAAVCGANAHTEPDHRDRLVGMSAAYRDAARMVRQAAAKE